MDGSAGDTSVALIDAGEGRRLERFGVHLVDRPAPAAVGPRRVPDAWSSADLRFEGGAGWLGRDALAADPDPWPVQVDGLTMELRPTTAGGVGLYPEHAANIAWLADRIRARRESPADREGPPRVLNLFAHTGLLTLAAARAGAAVAHVDAARTSVAWARRNARLNGLEDRPIRWLVDDARAFVEREARRGRRYDGLILDPPSFGHGPGRRSTGHGGAGGAWRVGIDLEPLLDAWARVAADDAFVLLSAHTTGLDPGDLDDALATLGRRAPDIVPLELVAASGARLELGFAARLDGRSTTAVSRVAG